MIDMSRKYRGGDGRIYGPFVPVTHVSGEPGKSLVICVVTRAMFYMDGSPYEELRHDELVEPIDTPPPPISMQTARCMKRMRDAASPPAPVSDGRGVSPEKQRATAEAERKYLNGRVLREMKKGKI